MAHANNKNLQFLALWVAALPLVTTNISYLVGVAMEHLPACIPYLSGCTTVSSAGRAVPESLIFKSGMLLSAAALVLLWFRVAAFLQSNSKQSSRGSLSPVLLLKVFGVLAALSLVVHVMALGLIGDEFQRLRRISINSFAVDNLIVQMLFIALYRHMRIDSTRTLFRWLVVICLALPVLAIAMELAKWLGMARRPTNNIGAWNAFIVVSAYYAVLARIWWHHGIAAGRAASPSE